MKTRPPSPPAPPGSAAALRPSSWSRVVAALDRVVSAIDDAGDRLWSSALNPLHQSGTIALACFGLLVLTGIYLFLFYSIDGPYESVSRIERELPAGSWVRSLHNYSADLALVATVLHALKMFLAGRFAGARRRAWLTGVLLAGTVLLCGWTGQVMVWDLQAQVVAVELTRLLDLLPVFSMPMGRAFDGLAPVPSSFFFMNLFLHVCLPLGLAFVLWMHLSRVARPALAAPRPVLVTVVAVLALMSAVVRVPVAAPADLLTIARDVPLDFTYNFWLPFAWRFGPVWHAAAWALATLVVSTVPWWWLRSRPKPAPSWVDPDHCTGCTTCYKDCPFDAITMVARPDPGRRSDFYALVNPSLCVSCGVCAGSCAPMSVGPPSRTGRVQLRREHDALAASPPSTGGIVVFACAGNRVASDPRLAALPGVQLRVVECAGGLHTSVVDLALRSGASGAFVLACPPRSASCREGPKWLNERLYHDREAELPPRVDKRRVAMAALSAGEWRGIVEAIEALRSAVAELDAAAAPAAAPRGRRSEPEIGVPGKPAGEPTPEDLGVDTECEPELEVSHG